MKPLYAVLKSDLAEIRKLQPDGWLTSIADAFEFYTRANFCHPIKYVLDGKIVGLGASILHANTAWLAHIIVHPNYRNKGIGYTITNHLIDQIDLSVIKTIQLVSTPMGKRLYERIGFKVDTEYSFYKGGCIERSELNLVPYTNVYQNELVALDQDVTGEKRQSLLIPHLESGKLVLHKNELVGFILPTLGEGYVCAINQEAGHRLLAERIVNDFLVMPDQNTSGLVLMKRFGYNFVRKATRMYLGEKHLWKPQFIYSRVGGNLG